MSEAVTHVVMFPGQGSEISDMGARVDEFVPEIGALARELIDPGIFERARESLAFFQPALLCATLAGWERVKRLHAAGKLDLGTSETRAFCGHSLGEFGAMVASGALTPEDGIRLVKLRGELLDEARTSFAHGAMMAMIGEGVQDWIAAHEDQGVMLANDNSPVQVVVSGRQEAMDWCFEAGKAAGFRVVKLPMNTGTGHTKYVEPVVSRLREALDATPFHEPDGRLWSASTAQPFDDPAQRLAEAVMTNVRWRELVLNLHAAGATRFVESGPGHVLSGLVRKTLGTDGIEAHTIADLEEAAAVG